MHLIRQGSAVMILSPSTWRRKETARPLAARRRLRVVVLQAADLTAWPSNSSRAGSCGTYHPQVVARTFRRMART